MNRRSFIHSILAGVVAPAFLPGAGRIWKPSSEIWVPKSEWITIPPGEITWELSQLDPDLLAEVNPDVRHFKIVRGMFREVSPYTEKVIALKIPS